MVTSRDQAVAADAIARYREAFLEPAHLPPLGVARGPFEATAGGATGRATLVRPEEATWNQWGPDRRPLLFNDRRALLAELEIVADGVVAWSPARTWVEVNRPDERVPPVPSAEHLLADLAWYALEQERWLLDGDLVQRTRYAGGWREAFLRPDGSTLRGVVAFELPDPEVHVGALRLTVGIDVDGAPRELVWVFQ